MATVLIQKRKRQNRFSHIIYYKDPLTGRRKYYKTFQRQKDAQQAANELRTLIDSGKISDIQGNKNKLNLLTFLEVSALLRGKWRELLEKTELTQKTFDEYICRLKVLNRTFDKCLLCEISKNDILGYQKEIVSEFSNVTSNRSLFVIKQVFKHGLEIRAVLEDPAAEISYLSEKDHERNKFLLPSEIDMLIEASEKTRAKFYMPALIYLGAEHGASKQEALSLEWSDIDFEFDGIGIIRFFRTKNSRKRTEYLMPRTREALLDWRDHLKWMRHRRKITTIKSNHVFCRLDGTPLKKFYKAWRVTCALAGIEDFHFHDLRHTFCSNLLLAGSDLKDVKEMIGHSDISMTDRYSHLTSRYKLFKQKQLAEHYVNNNGNGSGSSSGEHIGNTEMEKAKNPKKIGESDAT
jgi:integrase